MREAPVPAGEHGGDGARLAARLGVPVGAVLDLSQSLNPVAPDPVPVVAAHLASLGGYPDAGPAATCLAAHLDVDSARVVLTNGGAEAIALVADHLGRGWVDEPDFSLYRRHLRELDPAGPRFRSNPHSPSGRLAPVAESAAVWDEAFYPLATGIWTRGDADRGSWVVGSLTKLLACPGLRIGYVLAPDDDAARSVRARQPQWAVGALACAALAELLEAVDLPAWSTAVAELRSQLVVRLEARGYRTDAADANWVLVHDRSLRAALGWEGIAVRDCASFGLPGVARIAVPDAAGLDRLERALEAIGR